MSEIDFDRLLDAVNDALDEQTWNADRPFSIEPPTPANDNVMAWPLMPFPRGWHAAC